VRDSLVGVVPERDGAVVGPDPRRHVDDVAADRRHPVTASRAVTSGGEASLAVDDMHGNHVFVIGWPAPVRYDDQHLVTISVNSGEPAGLDLADGLALLSFLADALGVERYAPTAAPGGAT